MNRTLLRLAVLALVLVSCTGDELNLPSDGDPGTIEVLGGNDQNGRVGGSLQESLVVRVTDIHGRPVPDQRVEFTPTLDPSGQFLPHTVLTDDAGIAAARWLLGTQAGPQRAAARVVGAPTPLAAAFSATADPDPPDSLAIVGGDNQAEQIGNVLPESLIVVLLDRFGNPIAGADVGWSAQNGSLSSNQVTTGSDGRAAVKWTLGFYPGFQHATATYGNMKGAPVTFTAAATVGPSP